MINLFGVFPNQEPDLATNVASRLSSYPFISETRREVQETRATVNTNAFLDYDNYPADESSLRVHFWEPIEDKEYLFYEIHYGEDVNGGRGIGWHRDNTHNECGPTHLQWNEGGEDEKRESCRLMIDDHPINIMCSRIERLPDVIDNKWR